AVAAGRELADHAFRIRALLDALDKGRFDLRRQRLLGSLAAEVMLMAPAEVGNRADIDETGLEGLVGADKRETAEGRAGGAGTEKLGKGTSAHRASLPGLEFSLVSFW